MASGNGLVLTFLSHRRRHGCEVVGTAIKRSKGDLWVVSVEIDAVHGEGDGEEQVKLPHPPSVSDWLDHT